MPEPIRFSEVRTKEELDELKLFAASFGHRIDDTSLQPIIRGYRGDRLIGYFMFSRSPIIFPSFHTDPKICSHRDFRDSVEAVKQWACLNSMSGSFPNGTMWLAVDDVPAIGTELIEKLGFNDLKMRLFQYL